MNQIIGIDQGRRKGLTMVFMNGDPVVVMTTAGSYLRPGVVTFTRPNEREKGQLAMRPSGCAQLGKLGVNDADKITGLDVLRSGNAAVASSRVCGSNTQKDEAILVFDLGSGIFDISVLEVETL